MDCKVSLSKSFIVVLGVVLTAPLAHAGELAVQEPWILVMDNGEPGTSSTGTWTETTSGAPFDGTAVYTRRGTYTFVPRLEAGSYRVSLHWPQLETRLASNARVTIDTATGPQELSVSQRSGGRQWNLLGTFALNELSKVRFLVRNKYPVCVDAVAFEYVYPAVEPPPVDTPPATPTGIEAAASPEGIRVNWADAVDADFASFSLHRSKASTQNFSVLATGLTASAHVDNNIDVGTMYYYYVVAHDVGGKDSEPSAIVNAMLIDTAAPPAPLGLQALASSTAIHLDWADSLAGDLASYALHRSLNATQDFATVLVGLDVSACVDSTVLANTTYYYYVTARDDSGNESAPSAIVSARVESAPPAPPPPTSRSLTLGWTAPTRSADGTALTDLVGYKIYRGATPGNYQAPIVVGQVTEHTFPSLSLGDHYFAVTAHDTLGNESTLSVALFVRLE